jgi:hypothetical protein
MEDVAATTLAVTWSCKSKMSSRSFLALLTAARMRFGRAVHTKGLGSLLVSATKRVGDGSKHAAFEAPICELGEEAFDGIEPWGCRGWREVESFQRRCWASHLRTFGCL